MTARLFAKHFQICYVVRNAERAKAAFRDRFGVTNWYMLDVSFPESPTAALALAYVDDLMIELIEAVPGRPSIYEGWLSEGSPIRIHHLGFLVHSDEEWRGVIDQFAANGYPAAQAGSFGNVLDFHYADSTADLGHYCELIRLHSAGEALFANVPRN